jgi:hypothetical protein
MFDFLAGIVVFLGIKTLTNQPSISTPKDKGVTSSKRISETSPFTIHP